MQLVNEDVSGSMGHQITWSNGNYTQISAYILSIDWITDLEGRSVNSCFLYLASIVQFQVDICPIRKAGSSPFVNERSSAIFS